MKLPLRHLPENLKLDELAAKYVSKSAFVIQPPLKLQGATGTTVAPAALR